MTDFASRNKRNNQLALGVLWLAGLLIIVIFAAFWGYILYEGLPELAPAFIFGRADGVGRQLFNTLYILALSLLFSLPPAAGAAIYLSEYAPDNVAVRAARIAVDGLSAVPSIVLGLLGMIIFVQFFHMGFSIIGGALTLALLNLPFLTRVFAGALRAVPDTCRAASLALGATKWQTVSKVVLPCALPGMITGLMRAAGRAVGESALLIFTAGAARPTADFDLRAAGETLAVHIWRVMSVGTDHAAAAYGSAALLVIVILLLRAAFALLRKIAARG